MRLRILDPGAAGFVRAGIPPIFIQEHDDRPMMPDLTRRDVRSLHEDLPVEP